MSAKQVCIYCGAKATRWCDLVLGFDNSDGALATLETEIFRCDAPLCEAHAVRAGTMFISGSPEVAGIETIDHCCGHEPFWHDDLRGGWYEDKERWEPISADEAQHRRYRHLCLARGPLRVV